MQKSHCSNIINLSASLSHHLLFHSNMQQVSKKFNFHIVSTNHFTLFFHFYLHSLTLHLEHCSINLLIIFPFQSLTLRLGMYWIYLLAQYLTLLVFRKNFNQCVDHLPSSLTHLTFGAQFSQLVDHLPPSLTHITFGTFFKDSVNHLPLSLTHVTFRHWFNHPIDLLPLNVSVIKLGKFFTLPINILPPHLKVLQVCKSYPHIASLQSSFKNITIVIVNDPPVMELFRK